MQTSSFLMNNSHKKNRVPFQSVHVWPWLSQFSGVGLCCLTLSRSTVFTEVCVCSHRSRPNNTEAAVHDRRAMSLLNILTLFCASDSADRHSRNSIVIYYTYFPISTDKNNRHWRTKYVILCSLLHRYCLHLFDKHILRRLIKKQKQK